MKKNHNGWMIRILAISLCLPMTLSILAAPKKKKEILFPQREYVKEQSRDFFKNVDLEHPSLAKVEFFTRSETYLSAYLNLTVFLVKNKPLQEILIAFEKNHHLAVDAFNKSLQKLEIENYPQIQKELQMPDLTFYHSLICALSRDYQNNRLSGNEAFRLWNILLQITENIFKKGKKTAEHAAILEMSSHFSFFKKHKKWQKKAAKILKKIKKS
jgi:hypothetical protein